jgi:hypothetical protein
MMPQHEDCLLQNLEYLGYRMVSLRAGAATSDSTSLM